MPYVITAHLQQIKHYKTPLPPAKTDEQELAGVWKGCNVTCIGNANEEKQCPDAQQSPTRKAIQHIVHYQLNKQ